FSWANQLTFGLPLIPGRAMVVFNNKIWMTAPNGFNTGVWNSSDGIFWNQVTAAIPGMDAKTRPTLAVFQNKIWMVGGRGGINGDFFFNEVWSSDGNTW